MNINKAVHYILCLGSLYTGRLYPSMDEDFEDYLKCKNENKTNQFKCPG
jgi:hypothetical protein